MAASPTPAGGERRAAAGVALGLAGAALGASLVRAAAGAQRLEVASLAAGASGSVGARRGAARSLCLDYCAGVGSRDAACDICAVASFVHLHNAYEDAAGKPLGEGYYPYEYLAEVWQPTVFEVDDAVVGAAFLRRVASAAWGGGGGAADVAANGTAASVTPLAARATPRAPSNVDARRPPRPRRRRGREMVARLAGACCGCAWGGQRRAARRFSAPGAYNASLALEVRARGGAIYAYAYAFDVTVKHVRREIRRLTDADRGRFLDALQLMYSTPQDVGEALYGPKFKSGNYLVRKHLYGAASKDCDHWHDDAGVAPRRK